MLVSDDAVRACVFCPVERRVGVLDQLGRLLAQLPQRPSGAESHQQARVIVQEDVFGELALDACADSAGIRLATLCGLLAARLTYSGPGAETDCCKLPVCTADV
jgi:hypothetical protein